MVSVAAAVVLIAGSVLANPLTTNAPLAIITPCTSCPDNISVAPITVTSQYQTVSTCVPTKACSDGKWCLTSYPFETYQYVSTVIPCAFNSSASSSTSVTKTDQLVTVSCFRTTITSFSTPSDHRHAKPTPVYSTISQDYVLPYDKIGPLVVPGWDGSDLCADCEPDASGVRRQPLPVTECTVGLADTKCIQYTKTLVSIPAPVATSITAAACTTSFSISSAGTYTFRFPQTAPTTTISSSGQAYTFPSQSYNIWATRWFGHGGPWSFVTTITHTISQTIPPVTQPATVTHPASVPPVWGNEPSKHPSNAPSPSSSTGADPQTDWPSSSSSPSSSPSPSSSSADLDLWLDGRSSTSSSLISAAYTTSWRPLSTSATTTSFSLASSSTRTWWSSTTTSYSSSTTSSTSTTSSSSTTSPPALANIPTTISEIYITVNVANARYRKRAAKYVSFGSSEDGVLVSDISEASTFKWYEGFVIETGNGQYVGTDSTSGSAALEGFVDAASASDNWTERGGTLNFGDASFCYTPDNEMLIVFPGATAPAGCITCDLGTAPVSKTWNTTTTSTTRTTSSVYPTNSSSLTEREMESQESNFEQPEA